MVKLGSQIGSTRDSRWGNDAAEGESQHCGSATGGGSETQSCLQAANPGGLANF